MRRQSRMGDGASARDLVRSIEDMISESLIVARQQGASMIRIIKDDDGTITAKVADAGGSSDSMHARLTP